MIEILAIILLVWGSSFLLILKKEGLFYICLLRKQPER